MTNVPQKQNPQTQQNPQVPQKQKDQASNPSNKAEPLSQKDAGAMKIREKRLWSFLLNFFRC